MTCIFCISSRNTRCLASALLLAVVPFYEDIKKVNQSLDGLKLTDDPRVQLLDFTSELINKDGTVKAELFTSDKIHLTQEVGYGLFAEKLKPSLEKVLSR
jgi:lysophospholipase L1-like esterase